MSLHLAKTNSLISLQQQQEPKEHVFLPHNFAKPTWCDFCSGFIWGLRKQGYCCKHCKYVAHKKCYKSVTTACVPWETNDRSTEEPSTVTTSKDDPELLSPSSAIRSSMNLVAASTSLLTPRKESSTTKLLSPKNDLPFMRSSRNIMDKGAANLLRISCPKSSSQEKYDLSPERTRSATVVGTKADFEEEEGDAESQHQFVLYNFTQPTWCRFCGQFIWGLVKQGYRCRKCHFPAHTKCHVKVPSKCVQSHSALLLHSPIQIVIDLIKRNVRFEKIVNAINALEQQKQSKEDLALVLFQASQDGRDDLIRYLIETKGVDPHVLDSNGWSPLDVACHYGQLVACHTLLEEGMSAEGVTKDMNSSIYYFVRHIPNSKFAIPSLDPVIKPYDSIMNQLIASGANINSQNTNGSTPLHYACSCGKKEAVYLLIKNGAQIDLRDKQGNTCWEVAQKEGYSELASMISDFKQLTNTKPSEQEFEGKDLTIAQALYQELFYKPRIQASSIDESKALLLEHRFHLLIEGVVSRSQTTLVITKRECLDLDCPPPEFGMMLCLTSLTISHTKFQSLPPEIGLLTRLTALHIIKNPQLKALPDAIGSLFGLRDLILRRNGFTVIPSMIGQLTNLQRLDLSDNMLVTLPPQIGALVSLENLNLKDNRFDILPKEIGQLTKLTFLSLETNSALTHLPASFCHLTNLKQLLLPKENSWVIPPREIIQKQWKPDQILSYLRELYATLKPCYRIKLLLVGAERTGKSSLMKCLHRTDELDNQHRMTFSSDGVISIDSWTVNFTASVDGAEKQDLSINFSAWDFAGQETFYSTHQFFLTDRSIYLVTFDMTSEASIARIAYWLQAIESRKNSDVILVGTFSDLVGMKVSEILQAVEAKYRTSFPMIKHVFPVSCTRLDGIKELVDFMLETTLDVILREENRIPGWYIELENILSLERKKLAKAQSPPVITWEKLTDLASTVLSPKDLNDHSLRRSCAVLSSLGLLCYSDMNNSAKRDIVVLDPQWLVDVVASILAIRFHSGKGGILSLKDFSLVWRPPTFPEQLHPSLIDILEKYEILYHLPNNVAIRQKSMALSAGGKVIKPPSSPSTRLVSSSTSLAEISREVRYLVPTLLPETRPSLELVWMEYDANQIQRSRQYTFSFIPHGFFSRIVIRLVHQAAIQEHWKNGILVRLPDGAALALIEQIPEENTLKVGTRGPKAPHLLRIIVEVIDALLQHWCPRVKAKTLVPCIHCQRNQVAKPILFPLELCLASAAKGNAFVYCPNDIFAISEETEGQEEESSSEMDPEFRMQNGPGVPVRLMQLIPDVVSPDLESLQIDFKDVKFVQDIARSSFGTVFLGLLKEEQVAVKLLRGETMSDNEKARMFNELRQEVSILSGLKHQNIVNVKAYSINPYALIMEYAPCGTLYHFIQDHDQPMEWALKVKIALDISQGMEFLHSLSPPLLHRDLKSPNVLLMTKSADAPVVAKVSDFGASMRLVIATGKERAIENPTWLAPEVLRRDGYTTASDVYPFGIMLWEILTRTHPFSEMQFSFQVEEAVLSGKRPPLPREQSVSEIYTQLIERCWHQDPERRPTYEEITVRIMEIIQETLSDNVALISLPSESEQNLEAPLPAFSLDDHVQLNGRIMKQLQTDPPVKVACLLLVGMKVWCGCRDGSLLIFNVQDGSVHQRFERIHSGPITNLLLVDSTVWSSSLINGIVLFDQKQVELTEQRVQKQGFLQEMKSGGWKQRWFVLKNGTLAAYNKPHDAITGNKLNVWHLHDAKLTTSVYKKRSCFVITMPNGSQHHFCSNNEIEQKSWILALLEVIRFFLEKERIGVYITDSVSKRVTSLARIGDEEVWSGSQNSSITVWSIPDEEKKSAECTSTFTLDVQPFRDSECRVSAICRVEENVWIAARHFLFCITFKDKIQLTRIEAHEDSINDLIIVGQNVWSCSNDRTIRVWDDKTFENLQVMECQERVFCLLKVGHVVWSGAWDHIRLWDSQTFHLRKQLESPQRGGILSLLLVWGRTVWSSCVDNTICIWQ